MMAHQHIIICSEYFVGDNCHNKMQYDMGLVKKLILKKDAANVNETRPPPMTCVTVSAPIRPIV